MVILQQGVAPPYGSGHNSPQPDLATRYTLTTACERHDLGSFKVYKYDWCIQHLQTAVNLDAICMFEGTSRI